MIQDWMSWEGGVDLVASTREGLAMPNVIVHVARMVHTPVGSSASGMVFYQPDPSAAPVVMGFVSEDPGTVGAYFGPRIFAQTPFEQAPVLMATIEITTDLPNGVGAKVTVGEFVFETRLQGLGGLELVDRKPAPMSPFHQQGIEASASQATLKVNGKAIPLFIPPMGITGGAAAAWTPTGIYCR